MASPHPDDESQTKSSAADPDSRPVYILSDQVYGAIPSDDISLRELWRILWRGKWVIVGVMTLFAIASVTYALMATEWYRSEVLLAPADEKTTSAIGGQLGGLAALAGVSIGGGDSVEALAVLESREFARGFIEELDLLYVFFADEWDAAQQRWVGSDPEDWPEIRDAVKYFRENILSVNHDRQSGLVTLGVEWTDPETAAAWASILVRRVNERLRDRALREAETNVDFLQSELQQTTVVTLQQSIGRLLESELQKLMLARGNEEFAFRVIDSADVPKERVRPVRWLISILGTFIGGVVGTFIILLLHGVRAGASKGA
jgi:uncharacterized protein involved in exopolysaccharide biosynthesis